MIISITEEKKDAQFRQWLLLLILFFKAAFLVVIILYAGIGLGPDEAQYWTWSQALDWGYYSKPPGIAWQIWLGTQWFGQTEWGVRSLSVFLSLIQSLLIYRLALSTGLLARTAFWCALCMAFSPLGMMGSFLAITDVGFLLCWTGACLTVVTALHQNKEPNPLQIGGWIMVGALFKWPIYLFWIFVLCARYWYFPNQKISKLLPGVALSLLGLLPSLWWNLSHDWATFRHVSATLQGGSGQKATGNAAEFIGSQALLLSPILFILFIAALVFWFRQKKQLSAPLFFCGLVTIASLGIAILVSFFQKVQGNWVTFAYPTGLVLLAWDAFQQHPKRTLWVKIGLGLSLFLVSALFFLPSLYTNPDLTAYAPSYRVHPFKHNVGWTSLPSVLQKNGFDPKQHFLLSDKYQTTSILSFYGPDQQRAYFLNVQGTRNNQFSYWPSLQEERKNQVGYFVWIENVPHLERDELAKKEFYLNELQHYFEKVEFLEVAPLMQQGARVVKAAMIFRCESCRDVALGNSLLY